MSIRKTIITTIVALAVVAVVAPGMAQAVISTGCRASISTCTLPELMEYTAELSAQLVALQGGTTGVPAVCSGVTFTRAFAVGQTGSEVPCLKAYLEQVLGTTIGKTTLFGVKTKAAVKQYQALRGIPGGTGNLGPLTRAQ